MRPFLLPLMLLMSTVMSVSAPAADKPYQIKLGDFTVVALSDARNLRPLKALIANPEEVARSGVKTPEDPAPLQVNAFLVDTGRQVILIDTGLGAGAGHTLDSLNAAGYRPEQITAVLLTHMHGDHIGGLVTDGRANFPNATVYVERREAEYWTAPESFAAAPGSRKPAMEKARAALAPYANASHVALFDGAAEIFPGITGVPAYGHTPGHTAFLLASGSNRMLVWGDIVHLQQLQFPDPDVSLTFDTDVAQARATRKAVMAKAADAGYWVAGMHLAYPGIGHVRTAAGGYAWEPAD